MDSPAVVSAVTWCGVGEPRAADDRRTCPPCPGWLLPRSAVSLSGCSFSPRPGEAASADLRSGYLDSRPAMGKHYIIDKTGEIYIMHYNKQTAEFLLDLK